MAIDSKRRLEGLEAWSPTLYLIAGGLVVGYATFNGIDAFTTAAYPTVENAVGTAGFAIGFLGLLGQYPALADRSPRLARAGAGCAALGATAFSVFAVANLGQVAGVVSVSDQSPTLYGILLGMATLGMVPGYLSIAVASLRTGVHPRRVGLLLVLPATVFATMLTGGLTGFTPQWSAFLISSGQAVVHLSLGYTLWIGRSTVDRELSAGDVTAG